jgi:hypothetical protein
MSDLNRGWMPWRQWFQQHNPTAFKTEDSFEWFYRTHKDRLLRSGQYLPRTGRGGSMVGPRIESVIDEIFTEDALTEARKRGAA